MRLGFRHIHKRCKKHFIAERPCHNTRIVHTFRLFTSNNLPQGMEVKTNERNLSSCFHIPDMTTAWKYHEIEMYQYSVPTNFILFLCCGCIYVFHFSWRRSWKSMVEMLEEAKLVSAEGPSSWVYTDADSLASLFSRSSVVYTASYLSLKPLLFFL